MAISRAVQPEIISRKPSKSTSLPPDVKYVQSSARSVRKASKSLAVVAWFPWDFPARVQRPSRPEIGCSGFRPRPCPRIVGARRGGLDTVLGVPFDRQNAMLLAVGFAPVYGSRSLDAPEMRPIAGAIEHIRKVDATPSSSR